MKSLGQLGITLARSSLAGGVVRLAFAHGHRLLPLKRVATSEWAGAYHHPRPCYGTRHLLVVPHFPVADIRAFAAVDLAAKRQDFLDLAHQVKSDLGVEQAMINAGPRQDVGQMHMHLSDEFTGFTGTLWANTAPLPASSWDEAIRSLPSVSDLDRYWQQGLSLVETEPGVIRLA